jgi:type I restriction-modification system DNA methylase subunit
VSQRKHALSQVYEGLLLKMGEKGNDGGQFSTPREIIRAMVRVVDPRIGETIYDPAAGAPRGAMRYCPNGITRKEGITVP